MPEAPRQRPEVHEVLHSLRGHIRARPKAVFDALDARLRPGEEAESMYTADAAAFLIIAQGGWWYRAEYRVVPDEYGSNVEHHLLNVAQTGKRAGRFSGRKIIEATPAEFDRLLRELRLDLE